MLTFWLYVLALAALLYYPVNKLIWVFSVRRLQRKLNRELSEAELAGQLKRSRILTLLLLLPFSFLYNFNTLGFPGSG
jgi:hypothetical protein